VQPQDLLRFPQRSDQQQLRAAVRNPSCHSVDRLF